MKNKILKREHFEYLDNIVHILGFKNLADYDKCITYDTLKTLQNEICININNTLDTFKQLFPLNEFDLRKIKYKFENIDQVIGFVKKLFFYLNVPIEYLNKTLRLIQQNKLYNEYIKMIENRDIPQNELLFTDMDNMAIKQFTNDLNKPSKPIDEYKSYTEILKLNKSVESKESYLINNNIEFGESELDLIESIEFMIDDHSYKIEITFGGHKILTQEIDKFNNKICVNLPNLKLFYCLSTINIVRTDQDYCKDLTYEKNILQINLYGKIFENKINNQYIKFDHDTNFYSFYQMYVLDHDRISEYKFEQFDKAGQIYFSSVLKYLKQPCKKEYVINNLIDLSVTEFKYIHTIKIACIVAETTKRLKNGTKITLNIGGNVEYEKIITNDDVFDGKFYVFDLNLPNYYFYQYHRCEMSIGSDKHKKYFLEITGSDLKMSFPEKMLSKKILLDHDEKWAQFGNYIYVIWCGMIGKYDLIKSASSATNVELQLKQLYKNNKLHKSIFDFRGIEFDCLNVDNAENDHCETNIGLFLLSHDSQNEYYKNYNSVSVNIWDTLQPYIIKIIDNKVIIYYYLHRSADFLLEMKLLNLEEYEYEAYILSKNKKYTNFDEPYNLIGNNFAKIVIETHIDNLENFKNIDICIKGVYTYGENRKALAYMD